MHAVDDEFVHDDDKAKREVPAFTIITLRDPFLQIKKRMGGPSKDLLVGQHVMASIEGKTATLATGIRKKEKEKRVWRPASHTSIP